jgi:beta-carotene/zeaxanthin 4-ketolase
MNLAQDHPESLIFNRLDTSETSIYGVAIALLIISVWGISLGFFLCILDVEKIALGWKVVAIAWQTFLYTGLFITAHDAMHGTISPKHFRVNYYLGSLSLLLYGLFSYNQLLKTHWQHHHLPATDFDPDFHNGKYKNAIAWYFYFMQNYWSWSRFLGLVISYHLMHQILQIAEANLLLFWIIPTLLSSVQLFYFGTFLPHREPSGGYTNSFCAQSRYLPWLLSFLSCYHFSYHLEHHMFPSTPWWKLPAIAKKPKESNP